MGFLPRNHVSVTTTLRVKLNGAEKEYTTSIMGTAQMDQIAELQCLVDLAWKKTMVQNKTEATPCGE